jgi:hypothetical protein
MYTEESMLRVQHPSINDLGYPRSTSWLGRKVKSFSNSQITAAILSILSFGVLLTGVGIRQSCEPNHCFAVSEPMIGIGCIFLAFNGGFLVGFSLGKHHVSDQFAA